MRNVFVCLFTKSNVWHLGYTISEYFNKIGHCWEKFEAANIIRLLATRIVIVTAEKSILIYFNNEDQSMIFNCLLVCPCTGITLQSH